jgi:DNA-binding CsgD family transcriptional regulator
MTKVIDLDQHFSITSAAKVKTITAPLSRQLGIKHFRYLKLYADKSRVLLSNFPDCTRFVYEDGTYQNMWYDGEFAEHLVEGCHLWDAKRSDEKTPFEKEINQQLGLYHGITFVFPVNNYWEIYTFDSVNADIYQLDKKLLTHFMLYFKDQAAKLILQGESEKIIINNSQLNPINVYQHSHKDRVSDFLSQTRINRYYLGGKYKDVYLTSKEAQCIYWLIQGKSSEEIAMLENNSLKTIQRHLENVRGKLHCYKQTQLVKIILDEGIFDSLQCDNLLQK